MTAKLTKTKEELLVENAVLKYNEQVRKMLKEELSPLNSKIIGLEDRVEKLEDRVKEVEDIVEPFGMLRRRFWLFLISITLAVSVTGNKISEFINQFFN